MNRPKFMVDFFVYSLSQTIFLFTEHIFIKEPSQNPAYLAGESSFSVYRSIN